MTFIAGFLTGIALMVVLGLIAAWLWWAADAAVYQKEREE